MSWYLSSLANDTFQQRPFAKSLCTCTDMWLVIIKWSYRLTGLWHQNLVAVSNENGMKTSKTFFLKTMDINSMSPSVSNALICNTLQTWLTYVTTKFLKLQSLTHKNDRSINLQAFVSPHNHCTFCHHGITMQPGLSIFYHWKLECVTTVHSSWWLLSVPQVLVYLGEGTVGLETGWCNRNGHHTHTQL